jgi:hypothetical protein
MGDGTNTIQIKILLRGVLRKLLDGGELLLSVPAGTTCGEALQIAGIDWETLPSFGFVSVNNKRVMIDSVLSDGDLLKAFSRVGGG